MGDITGDTGEGLDIRNIVSGTDVIGIFPSGTFYAAGSNVILQSLPIDTNVNNPAYSFIYDATGNIGSVTQYVGLGSYTKSLTWANGSVLTNVGSYI